MPALRVNGVELEYDESGSGETIIVSAQQEFEPNGYLKRLAGPPTGYHVFALRLRRLRVADQAPGEDVQPRWYQRWADDVYAAIQALGLSRFIYTGVSHGAVIGWHLAVQHPHLLRGLIAIVGVPQLRSSRSDVSSGRASQMAARTDLATLRAGTRRLFGPTSDPDRLARREALVEARIQRILATPPDEAAVKLGIGFPDVQTDAELLEMLHRVSTPTLILGGMHDPWVTPEALLRTARVVPAAKLVMFEDESHLLATESPSRVTGEFKLFADGLAASSHGRVSLG